MIGLLMKLSKKRETLQKEMDEFNRMWKYWIYHPHRHNDVVDAYQQNWQERQHSAYNESHLHREGRLDLQIVRLVSIVYVTMTDRLCKQVKVDARRNLWECTEWKFFLRTSKFFLYRTNEPYGKGYQLSRHRQLNETGHRNIITGKDSPGEAYSAFTSENDDWVLLKRPVKTPNWAQTLRFAFQFCRMWTAQMMTSDA